MTTRKEALQELLAKVEAGVGIEYAAYRKAFDGIDGRPHEMYYPILRDQARLAFCGSLDAAKALHEAVLPGWEWSIESDGEVHVDQAGFSGIRIQQNNDTPARAWLTAIIKALIAQEVEK